MYSYTQNISLLPKDTILSDLLPLFSKDPCILLYSLLLFQSLLAACSSVSVICSKVTWRLCFSLTSPALLHAFLM